MSQTDTGSDETDLDGPEYAAHNWWGRQMAGDTDDGDTGHADGAPTGNIRARWVAFSLLRETATFVSGAALEQAGDDDLAVEPVDPAFQLGEPEHYPPYDKIGKNRHALRCDDAGRLNWDESTWVVIADRSEEELLRLVDMVLEDLPDTDELLDRQKREVRHRVKRMKREADDLRDLDIMQHVVDWLDRPEQLT
jgi:hypothetical protein